MGYTTRMRPAYALLGVAWLAVFAAVAWSIMQEPAHLEDPRPPMERTTLTLISPDFESGSTVPSRFTCDGDNTSPALQWEGIPERTKSLALIMDDPDVPKALRPDGVFDHWTLFNIPPETMGLPAGGTAGVPGVHSGGQEAYTGPCPPREYEPSEHRYFFRLYALDAELPLAAGATKGEVLTAMEGHVLAQAELMGRYKRQ